MQGKEELLILGRIEGRLEEMRASSARLSEAVRRIEDQMGKRLDQLEHGLGKRLDSHDARIRGVEVNVAKTGAVSGAGAAAMVTAIVEALKHLIK